MLKYHEQNIYFWPFPFKFYQKNLIKQCETQLFTISKCITCIWKIFWLLWLSPSAIWLNCPKFWNFRIFFFGCELLESFSISKFLSYFNHFQNNWNSIPGYFLFLIPLLSFPILQLLFFKLISLLYPTSDLRHPVVTPCIILMLHILHQCRLESRKDIASSLFIIALILEVSFMNDYSQSTSLGTSLELKNQHLHFLCMQKEFN